MAGEGIGWLLRLPACPALLHAGCRALRTLMAELGDLSNSRMFSGFRSRWMTFLLCANAMKSSRHRIFSLASFSLKWPCVCRGKQGQGSKVGRAACKPCTCLARPRAAAGRARACACTPAARSHLGNDLVEQLAARAQLHDEHVRVGVLEHLHELHDVGVVLQRAHDGDFLDDACVVWEGAEEAMQRVRELKGMPKCRHVHQGW